MKKMILLSGLSLFCFVTAIWADKTGVGAERNQDRTGSPFAASSTQQCDKCHSGGNFNSAITLTLKDSGGNIVTEYNGGETYTYEVQVTGTGSRFGFQSVALLTSNNTNAGVLTASSSNAKITTLGGTRKYAEHNNPSVSGLFVMNWVAPAPGSGTVKFYASGNCVNNNNDDTGDDPVNSAPMTITESAVSGINETGEVMISVYPNPASSVVNIKIPDTKSVDVSIVDANGRLIESYQDVNNTLLLDVSGYAPGIYFIQFTGDIVATKKLIR